MTERVLIDTEIAMQKVLDAMPEVHSFELSGMGVYFEVDPFEVAFSDGTTMTKSMIGFPLTPYFEKFPVDKIPAVISSIRGILGGDDD